MTAAGQLAPTTWEQVLAEVARKARETERRRTAKPSLGRMLEREQVGRKA